MRFGASFEIMHKTCSTRRHLRVSADDEQSLWSIKLAVLKANLFALTLLAIFLHRKMCFSIYFLFGRVAHAIIFKQKAQRLLTVLFVSATNLRNEEENNSEFISVQLFKLYEKHSKKKFLRTLYKRPRVCTRFFFFWFVFNAVELNWTELLM